MLFLFTTRGILRGDTAFKLELADLFHVNVKRHDDPHLLTVFILQFVTGKSNHSVKLYGQVARHVNVKMGSSRSIFSIVFLLQKKYMEDLKINFLDNSIWFDIKFLLTKSWTTDRNKTIRGVLCAGGSRMTKLDIRSCMIKISLGRGW